MNKLEKSILCGFLIAVIVSMASGFTTFAGQCSDIRQNVLRLHILANSDSSADQALKIKVRDKILAKSGELFQKSDSKADAIQKADARLEEIRKTAQNEVVAEGYDYKVQAKIVHMYFTTRTYGNITLPAGNYDAVRITIGKAQGHNWWCVLFPPLCLPSAEGTEKLSDVLNSDEVGIVTGSGDKTIVIKFKVLEWYEDAKNFISDGCSKAKDALAGTADWVSGVR
ncbi:MAG TPA: stage II sporulation protein R [Clostridia bacterium]|nr:stage II sporulation protein R [Clostridia bacterium]